MTDTPEARATHHWLVQPELLSDCAREGVLDLGVSRDRNSSSIRGIHVEVVVRAVALQIAAALDQSSNELPPLHSEIESSCRFSGTNELSAVSASTSS